MSSDANMAPRGVSTMAALMWYTVCAVSVFGTMAQSQCGGIVYCYGDSRDYWWHPSRIAFALIFSLVLPVPHLAVAVLFKSGRNIRSVAAICRSWHRTVGIGLGLLIALAAVSSYIQNSFDRRLPGSQHLSAPLS